MNNNISDILILILLVIALLALPIIGFVIGCKKHKRGLAKAGAIVLAIYSWFIGFGVIGGLSVLFKFNALGIVYLLFGYALPWAVYSHLMDLFDEKYNINILPERIKKLSFPLKSIVENKDYWGDKFEYVMTWWLTVLDEVAKKTGTGLKTEIILNANWNRSEEKPYGFDQVFPGKYGTMFSIEIGGGLCERINSAFPGLKQESAPTWGTDWQQLGAPAYEGFERSLEYRTTDEIGAWIRSIATTGKIEQKEYKPHRDGQHNYSFLDKYQNDSLQNMTERRFIIEWNGGKDPVKGRL